ncbi:MAG: reprolysin-like metallopeptidase, partial [Rubripirellula sp.]
MRTPRSPRDLRRKRNRRGSMLRDLSKQEHTTQSRRRVRTLLTVESLEPRHLLAGLVGIDFDVNANSRPSGWHTITGAENPTSLTNLADVDGSQTSIDFALVESGSGSLLCSANSVCSASVVPNASTLPAFDTDLAGLDGQIFSDRDPIQMTWSGLAAGTEYEIYVFGLEGHYASIEQTVTIAGEGAPVQFDQNFDRGNLQVNGQLGSSALPLSSLASVVTADASGEIVIDVIPDSFSLDTSLGGVAIREVPVPALIVTIADDAIFEGDGSAATTATVSRIGVDATNALTVTLTSSDTSEASVPASVIIPAGQTSSLPFNVAAVDDIMMDQIVNVTLTASAPGLANGSSTLDVIDDDALLTVVIDEMSAIESAGVVTATAVVTRTDTVGELAVGLSSSNTSRLEVPTSVTITNGLTTSEPFSVTILDNAIDDENEVITVSATAPQHVSISDSLTVVDDDVDSALTVDISPILIHEDDSVGASIATVSRPSSNLFASYIRRGVSVSDGVAGSTQNVNGAPDESVQTESRVGHGADLNSSVDTSGFDANGFAEITIGDNSLGTIDDEAFFEVYFDVATTTAFDFDGFVAVSGADGTALASIELTGPGLPSPLSFTRTTAASGRTDIAESGLLTPGTYRFIAIAQASSAGTDPSADAEFSANVVLSPIEALVNLTGDPSEISIPTSITIPADQSSFAFNINPVDDVLVDGDQTVLVVATSAGNTSGSDTVLVVDNDQNYSTGESLQVYRLALAATGEITAQLGGVAPTLDLLTSTVAAINNIFEPELAISLQLVTGTELIFGNAATDPY